MYINLASFEFKMILNWKYIKLNECIASTDKMNMKLVACFF